MIKSSKWSSHYSKIVPKWSPNCKWIIRKLSKFHSNTNISACKCPLSLSLSIGSMLERSILKNAAQRTSQRLKWTSGARLAITVEPLFLRRFFVPSLDLYIFWNYLSRFLIQFWGFRATLIVLAVWAGFFKSEWHGNHPKLWSGDDFWTCWDAINCAETFVVCTWHVKNKLFKTASTTQSRSATWSPSKAS